MTVETWGVILTRDAGDGRYYGGVDIVNTLVGVAVSRPVLRTVNILIFALAGAAAVSAHLLWYHDLIGETAELTTYALCALAVSVTIICEAVMSGRDKREQRGFGVILDDRSDEE